jgi:hypothetical protein
MPESNAVRRLAYAAQKWRDLVERRTAYLVELEASGRWSLFYTKPQFLALLREALDLAERWAAIAPRSEGEGRARRPAA